MQSADSASAPLTAALIRRAVPLAVDEPAAVGPSAEAAAPPAWHDDLRLFAITWAAGFVFFLAFIG